jgi:hypothetical protein
MDPSDFYCQPVLADTGSHPHGPLKQVRAAMTYGFSPGTPMVRFKCENFNNGCSGGLVKNGEIYKGPILSSPGQYAPGFNVITHNSDAMLLAFTSVEFWLYISPKNGNNFTPHALLRTIQPSEVCDTQAGCCSRFREFRTPVSINIPDSQQYDFMPVLKVNANSGAGAIINPANPMY